MFRIHGKTKEGGHLSNVTCEQHFSFCNSGMMPWASGSICVIHEDMERSTSESVSVIHVDVERSTSESVCVIHVDVERSNNIYRSVKMDEWYRSGLH